MDDEARGIANRLLDGIESDATTWAIEEIPGLVSIAWYELQARAPGSATAHAKAIAMLRAKVKQLAAGARQQMQAASERDATDQRPPREHGGGLRLTTG